MEPAENVKMDTTMEHSKRAYSPSMDNSQSEAAPAQSAVPHVVYVTETRTECSCKSTPALDSTHVSQIPVHVPTSSSSMGAMLPASSPAMSNGVVVGASSSSALFGSQMSAATPTPSGASANHFNTFQGAAPAVNAARGGAAALGVAAIMGLMIAL